MKYIVEIRTTLHYTEEIEASSQEDAELLAEYLDQNVSLSEYDVLDNEVQLRQVQEEQEA